MKKTLFIFLIGFLNLYAQNINEKIKKDFNDYSKLIVDKKIDEALEYVNPKLFEIFPKDEMAKLLGGLYNNPDVEFKISTPTIQSYGNSKTIDNINYVKIKAVTPVEMKFINPEFTDELIPFYVGVFEERFGKGNVLYDEKSKYFKISSPKSIIASSTDQNKSWKFITIDNENMNFLLEKIIPKEVLK